ncbi:hypothetical protein AAW26_23705 [Vibrio alginolyticus]|uniref:hypothetical protein n=1 Tax=Vibrio alginolyticus TaxID=663 RepID=UPI00063DB1F6|nr:hypothetical protein [Vibrio alginolyticus]KLI69882.1 hypothetical protein AAW26_23705 [Vibrio alginolyticus]
MTFTPEHQAIGQSVTVTLEFDKDLQSAAAELGGTTITSLMATADPSVWTGDVVVPDSSELNVALLVRDYQDFSGQWVMWMKRMPPRYNLKVRRHVLMVSPCVLK